MTSFNQVLDRILVLHVPCEGHWMQAKVGIRCMRQKRWCGLMGFQPTFIIVDHSKS